MNILLYDLKLPLYIHRYIKHRTFLNHIVHLTSYFAHFYLLLIATTGSIRAAIDAGIMPANIPIEIQIEMASAKIPGDI